MESLQTYISNQKDLISFIQSDISKDEYLAELLDVQISDLVSNAALIEEKLTDSGIAEKVMKYLCGDYEIELEEDAIFQCYFSAGVYTRKTFLWVFKVGEKYISFYKNSDSEKIDISKRLPIDFCMKCCLDLIDWLEIDLEAGKECLENDEEFSDHSSFSLYWNFDFISHWKEYVKQLEKDVDRIWNKNN